MGKYTQVFRLQYSADPELVWSALQRAIDDMDGAKLGAVDDAARERQFSTGVTLTSWGEELQAAAVPGAQGSTQVEVRGKPKGTFLSTKWGEEVHASRSSVSWTGASRTRCPPADGRECPWMTGAKATWAAAASHWAT